MTKDLVMALTMGGASGFFKDALVGHGLKKEKRLRTTALRDHFHQHECETQK